MTSSHFVVDRGYFNGYYLVKSMPFELIISFLEAAGVKYRLIEHEPVFTSEQAARVRGISASMGAKSLLLKAEGGFMLAVLSGNLKLDVKKLEEFYNVKEARFAKLDEVKVVMGCEVGACYPFGNLIGVRMLVDNELAKNKEISFNPGVHNKSLIMKWEDYKAVVNPTMADISK